MTIDIAALRLEGIPNTTDAGNAEFLASRSKNTLRYDHLRDRWLVWNEHHWQPDNRDLVVQDVIAAARARYTTAETIEDLKIRLEVAKWAIQSESAFKVQACLTLAKALDPIADDGLNWDSSTMLLGATNGVIDLTTGQLRPGKQEDRVTMNAGAQFDPAADCPRWRRFLLEVFDGDVELIDWLHRVLGYTITGDTSEQCVFMGYGAGSNGKGVFCNTLQYVLGKYAYTAPFSTFELHQRASIPNDLAALEFKRFVNSSETNERTRLNEARIKAISGCDPITARYLHQEFFTYWPHLKLWLFVNHKPTVIDDSFGFWRRVRLIPFVKTFEGEADDKHLKGKLREEAPAILAWLVQGCLEWQKRGLDPIPESVKVATEEYKHESDDLAEFISTVCVEHPRATVKASRLYTAFKQWAETQGMGPKEIVTSTTFGKRIAQRYHRQRTREGAVYTGIGLHCDGLVTGFEPSVTESNVCPIQNLSTRETAKTHHNPSPAMETRHTPGAGNHDNSREDQPVSMVSNTGDSTTGDPWADYDHMTLRGLTADQVIEIWRAEGSPSIEIGPGEAIENLAKCLNHDPPYQTHIEAIHEWLTSTLQARRATIAKP